MIEIDVTAEEISRRALADAHREAAVEAIRRDGFVVLKNVVDTAHLDILRDKMLEDVRALMARKDAPYNWNASNIQQNPPPFPPYLFRDVLVNEMVIDVTKRLLGPGMTSSFYSGNTALPSATRQPVHADTGHLWPSLEVAHPASSLVVNVPTVHMFPENGSTEIWPGSHRDTTITIFSKGIEVPEEALERRRAIAPPLQPTVQRGSVLIRDIRLWHAGMPNRTDQPRPMIALIHNIHWAVTGTPLRFSQGTEELFQHPDLTTLAEFVDDPIDHIGAPQAYKYEGR